MSQSVEVSGPISLVQQALVGLEVEDMGTSVGQDVSVRFTVSDNGNVGGSPTTATHVVSINVTCPPAAPAPTLESAKFLDDLSGIRVSFQGLVDRGSASSGVSCNTVFDTTTVNSLGGNPSCAWVDTGASSAVLVTFGVAPTLSPKDNITLAASAVYRCAGATLAASGHVSVALPDTPLACDVTVVDFSEQIGVCEDWTASAVASGLGGRSASFSWSTSDSSLLDSVSTTTTSITVPRTNLRVGVANEVRACSAFSNGC